MKFGFIMNPADMERMNLLRMIEGIRGFQNTDNKSSPGKKSALEFITISELRSLNGSKCDGKIVCIPKLHHEILENQKESVEEIINVAKELEEWGAEIIGLGGATGIVGSRGSEIQAHLNSSYVTTGNSYTAYASVAVLENILSKLQINIQEEKCIVIGFPGSISLVIARIIAKKGINLILVSRTYSKIIQDFVDTITNTYNIEVEVCKSVNDSLKKGKIILSATSSGNIIDQQKLLPSSIVIDIAEPKDVIGTKPERSDVLIVDGGRFNLKKEVFANGIWGQLLKNHIPGCLGETMLLALENRKENFSIGRELDINKIEEIGRIGEKHGYTFDTVYSFGKPVKENIYTNIKKIIFKNSGKSLIDIEKALESSKDEVFERYCNHVNPVITEISKIGKFDKTFIKAEGIYVWDTEGKKYYDFIGGYGSVNIGHNHPKVLDTIHRVLNNKIPSLLQASPGIIASALAENLSKITPEDLEFVFLCNSGTEANEGALKLSRIYTGRKKIVYTDNSFHGKTFGSLSVTGRNKYKQFFEPLLPECICVPYGELKALNDVLINEDVAAFIVEPIQGEGGVIIPTDGYLTEAEKMCRKHKTLMILDEVQTGFGRTGKMFAAEHDGLRPDILTVAKSLGGGMVPIGAYITTREIWEKAYGNIDRFLLHTSTFGGNNISAAVGVTTINVIYEEKLIDNANHMGEYFMFRLKKLKEKYDFIHDVRGRGLMIGIEFSHCLNGGGKNLRDELFTMMPVEIISFFKMVPEDIKNSIDKLIDDITEKSEKIIADFYSRRISSKLLNEYNILTLSTLNNPNVMRIQPPLSITKEQIDFFVDSLDEVCRSIEIGYF